MYFFKQPRILSFQLQICQPEILLVNSRRKFFFALSTESGVTQILQYVPELQPGSENITYIKLVDTAISYYVTIVQYSLVHTFLTFFLHLLFDLLLCNLHNITHKLGS